MLLAGLQGASFGFAVAGPTGKGQDVATGPKNFAVSNFVSVAQGEAIGPQSLKQINELSRSDLRSKELSRNPLTVTP